MEEIMRVGDIELDTNLRICSAAERSVRLTPMEFIILSTLMKHPNETVSADDVFRENWENDGYVRINNCVSVHIRHLRLKLDENEPQRFIKTVWKKGYRINA